MFKKPACTGAFSCAVILLEVLFQSRESLIPAYVGFLNRQEAEVMVVSMQGMPRLAALKPYLGVASTADMWSVDCLARGTAFSCTTQS